MAHLTILKSDQIELVQNGGKALKGLALLLTIIVPLLYALALLLARGRRRRTLMTIGFAVILAGVVVLAGRSLIESQTVNSLVKNDANIPAAKEVMSIATSMLSEIAGAFVVIGDPARPRGVVRRPGAAGHPRAAAARPVPARRAAVGVRVRRARSWS